MRGRRRARAPERGATLLILGVVAACADPAPARLDGDPALAYTEFGAGSVTFVLVPSARSGSIETRVRDWNRLDEAGRVLVYDARGCGRSPVGRSGWWTDHVDDLRRLIDQRAVGRVILVAGQSDAAVLALLFAYRHPARASGLILAAASRWPGPYVAALDTLPERTLTRLDSLIRGESVGPLYRLDTVATPVPARDTADRDPPGTVCPGLLRGLSEGRAAMPNFYDLASIRHPVLIMHGESRSSALAALLVQSRYVTVPGVEGSPWRRAPDAFFGEVASFARAIEISPGATRPRWTLVSELEIGGTYDDRLPFNQIIGAVTDSLGSLHLVTRSPVGRWTVDRSGNISRQQVPGPAEALTAIGWTGLRPDAAASSPAQIRAWIREGNPQWGTLTRSSRLLALASDGAPSDTIAFVLPPTHPAYGPLQPAFLLADGTVMAEPGTHPSPTTGDWVRSVPIVRATSRGVVMDTLAHRPLRPERIVLRGGAPPKQWSSMVPHPLPSSAQAAIDPHGRWLTVVDPNPDGTHDTYRVARVAIAGDTLVLRRNAYEPIDFPERELERIAIERYRESTWLHGETTPRRYQEAFRQAVGEIDAYPTITGALAGVDGSVWVRREALPLATRRWTILDESGAEVADVEVPAAVELFAVESHVAWGTRATSWGPTLERFRATGSPP